MEQRLHVDVWLDIPAKDESEKIAKEFLEQSRKPAMTKDYTWMAENPLFCTYKDNKTYRCVGASRLGDVWLSSNLEKESGYDIRVAIEDCVNWRKNP